MRHLVATKMVPAVPHADTLLMMVASAQILWAWIFEPFSLDRCTSTSAVPVCCVFGLVCVCVCVCVRVCACCVHTRRQGCLTRLCLVACLSLHPAYFHFLNTHGGQPRPVIEMVATVQDPVRARSAQWAEVREFWAKLQRTVAPVPTVHNITCEVRHPGQSCSVHLLQFWYLGFLRAIKVYLPVHVFPLIVYVLLLSQTLLLRRARCYFCLLCVCVCARVCCMCGCVCFVADGLTSSSACAHGLPPHGSQVRSPPALQSTHRVAPTRCCRNRTVFVLSCIILHLGLVGAVCSAAVFLCAAELGWLRVWHGGRIRRYA